MIGTNMLFNNVTFTNPSGISAVQNLTHPDEYLSSEIKSKHYKMTVPRNLEYSSIVGDSPTLPSPYAGSPGCVVLWGERFTASTAYFLVDIEAVWQLRGRN
jgi:hypothetical protein